MIKVIQISTECYPAAKAGGMGDVVGAMPLYFHKEDIESSVLIPRYDLPFFNKHNFKSVFNGAFHLGGGAIQFDILKLEDGLLDYPFYCVDIPSLFRRNSVYLAEDGKGFRDESLRNISFQRAALVWMNQLESPFQLIHCHDHQTGLIPFFVKFGIEFPNLRNIPTYYTIHNSAYQGTMPWALHPLLPSFNEADSGLLEWNDQINSFAAAIKNAWKLSTVSPSYLNEIQYSLPHLNTLLRQEAAKSVGILNGIDTELWDPKTDSQIKYNFKRTWKDFKAKNKKYTCDELGLDEKLPLFTFIGRLAHQKGADIIPQAIEMVYRNKGEASFVILGSGDKDIENYLLHLNNLFEGRVKVLIMYNEQVAHQLYASSDFLLMPSRFEPCGLNQMFSMRYGTIPIVRATGGLKDTVKDVIEGGTGISFQEESPEGLAFSIFRGLMLYNNPQAFADIMKKCVNQNFSWSESIKQYAQEYKQLISQVN